MHLMVCLPGATDRARNMVDPHLGTSVGFESLPIKRHDPEDTTNARAK